MTYLLPILILFVAVLHLYFMILEMFLWTKPKGLKVFAQSLEKARSSAVLAANQGLYNGILAAGLGWSALHPNPEIAFQLRLFFLSAVVLAGGYGGWTVSRKIALFQAGPALLGLVLTALS